jgi:hypothetical protein
VANADERTSSGASEHRNRKQYQQHSQHKIESTNTPDLLDYEMLLCMSNLIVMDDTNVDHFFSSIELLLEKQKTQKIIKIIKPKKKNKTVKIQKNKIMI